ncbi:Protein of unknown function [Carboxydocella sporoproducens DSM 16521]|uniref:DUF7744 domain-containing protein n=2 Tax=Carboxydocella TaxID=178898 RepID=A0A1T4MI90_9FIRM|nr:MULTISPECIES: DUF499 domain-containing protein [Carboxydocella]AVX21337.1 Protein of unknown function (DUF499) [Carboxydocella thermautotrophica]SJZ66585.1 Protein of unknown function [Carboxydocella sporoproducens DSM 16521]
MRSVLETCQPRPELLAGTFNPEVFTASLGPVIEYYRTGARVLDNLYTNAELFFREATFPTQGLKTTLFEVFSRLAGDNTAPAIHRLETAFGGGKTHTLIACTHIAYRGKELAEVVNDIISPDLLPEPGTVQVVGIAGDEIPVHQTRGQKLVPYTLWGEIAYQIGGEKLYLELEEEVNSYAAPGRTFFEKALAGRKVIIMLDELAQYAARLEAARPDGASQLAAFLMGLHNFARTHSGVTILLTLASATDAFAKQTEQLAKLISQVRGEEVSEDDAINIGEKAVKGITSVVARDAVPVTPVQAAEISAVLAKRLFASVDRAAAEETAEEYMKMYKRNSNLLPEEAATEDYRNRMVANYPFHPTLVDFLNKKLASAENFQGTRGVLRVLALAVRSLWLKKKDVPMIHACHLDLREERIVNEILGRTGRSEILFVLNADIGSVDTGTLEGGASNAELADRRNPHPEGYPLYEYTWKTVFLHSLVGNEEGLGSRIFGITEADALFAVAFPGMTPPQVKTALEEINESAYYLKFEQGKYFASEEPTINSILARIRRTIRSDDIKDLLAHTARKIITDGSGLFHIEHDVVGPEDIPDGKNRLVLGVVSLFADTVDVQALITYQGFNQPRMQQNIVFVLVPDTVTVTAPRPNTNDILFADQSSAIEIKQRIEGIARQVKAMRILKEKPQSFGVNPQRLDDDDFKKRFREREQALITAVSEVYTGLYYPSTTGHIVRKEIKTAGGEGGTPFIELMRETLIKDRELLTSANVSQSDLMSLKNLFFSEDRDSISLQKLRENFYCLRHWPVVENNGVFEQIIRAGVQKGVWCLFRMENENSWPAEFYDQETDLPMSLNLSDPGYWIVTPQGANKRGWNREDRIDPEVLRRDIIYKIENNEPPTWEELNVLVTRQYGDGAQQQLQEEVVEMLKRGELLVCRQTGSSTMPEIISGNTAIFYTPMSIDRILTPEQAQAKGLLDKQVKDKFTLRGKEGAEKIWPLLHRIGSIYNRGAKTKIDYLDLTDLTLPDGGTLRLELNNASPKTMKMLGELFEVLANVVSLGENTEVILEVEEPDESCLLMQELKK